MEITILLILILMSNIPYTKEENFMIIAEYSEEITGDYTYFSSDFQGEVDNCAHAVDNIYECVLMSEITSLSSLFKDISYVKSVDLQNFDSSNIISIAEMFSDCNNLLSIDFTNFNTKKVTNMSSVFMGCSKLVSLDVSSFNTSLVTDMSYMFKGCNKLASLDVGHFNTNQVTTMSYMFKLCKDLTTLDVSKFDTGKVKYMSEMFYGCSKLTKLDVSNFNTNLVLYMGSMFYDCSLLESIDVSKFNTIKVSSMNNMFSGCSSLVSIDVSNFITNKVTTMNYMFSECSSLVSINISNFNTTIVKYMGYMFYECSQLTSLDLGSFNTSKVTTMQNMFNGCSKLASLDLSKFNTEEVSNMQKMFYGCSLLKSLDLSSFDTSSVTTMESMFQNCTSLRVLLISNFTASLAGTLTSMFQGCVNIKILNMEKFTFKSSVNTNDMFSGCNISMIYCINKDIAPTDVITQLEDFPNLYCSDTCYRNEDNKVIPNKIKCVDNCENDDTYKFEYYDTCHFSYIMVTYENEITDGNFVYSDCQGEKPECIQIESNIYRCFWKNIVTTLGSLFYGMSNIISVDFSSFNASKVTSMSDIFNGCYNLQSINFNNINTIQVTSMSNMFNGCTNLISLDLGNFNTGQVMNMQSMFSGCTSLISLNLNNFITTQVTNMQNMFYGCTQIVSLHLGNFYTNQVTNLQDMFNGCSQLISLDLSKFNTNKVTNMQNMFYGCSQLTSLDLSKFNTNKVTNMQNMFYGCSKLTSLDLSSFDTSLVTTMESMFQGCSSMKVLILKNFITSQVDSMSSMFQGCNNIKILNMEKFTFKTSVNTNDMLSGCNISMIYCIDKDNSPNQIKTRLTNFPNLYCSDTCYKNENNKILSCSNTCIEKCQFDNKYKYEYENFCYLSENHNNLCIDNITEISNDLLTKSTEEVIEYLDTLIKGTDPTETYVINGDNTNIIIKPIDAKVEGSSVNIDFSACEKILKEKYPGKQFRIIQMNIENKAEKNLVDQVEYKIYDQNGDEIDLSVCDDVEILVEYKIKNTSQINMEQVSGFQDMGVDVFNIKDEFFNDICYSYSDDNSSSDMILSDRVSDIFQNVSICGDGCEYVSFNKETNSANCNCKVKKEISTELETGNFQSYVMGAFFESNFGAIKCYNIVFSFKGKLKNIGFWIFGAMLIFHIPLYIYYFIHGVSKLQHFLLKEMEEKGYTTNERKLEKRKKSTSFRRDSGKDVLSDIKETESNLKSNNIENTQDSKNNPPRRKKDISINDTNSQNDSLIKNKYRKSLRDNEKKIRNIKKKMKTKTFGNIKLLKKANLGLINPEHTSTIDKDDEKPTIKIDIKKNKNKNKNKFHNAKRSHSSVQNNYILNIKINSSEHLVNKNNIDSKHDTNHSFSHKHVNHHQITPNPEQKGSEDSKEMDTKPRLSNRYSLILIDLNQKEAPLPYQSDYVIDNFDYEQAIIYENRSYCRIFFIILISKENVLNMIIFDPPLELKPIRIAIFIFNFACDYALNALFYLSDNISDKYHYEGAYRELFSLINNLPISITSTLVSFILLFFFENLTQSTEKIEKLFRDQEDLIKNDKSYKVTNKKKKEIMNNIKDIMKCLRLKIIFFIVLESLVMFFFFYYVTAFCQIYKSTQKSWILDCLMSYAFSLAITIFISLVFGCLYKIAIKYKVKCLYQLIKFLI